jgi:mRNA-degrading endonuclease RelE of RelBE toxin-antitoxin system
MNFNVEISKQAKRDMKALREGQRAVLAKTFRTLATGPRPRGSRTLRGSRHLFVLQVGKFGVIYDYDERLGIIRILTVYDVGHRNHETIWQRPKIRALLAQPVGAPIELTPQEARAIAREAFGKRPDLPPGEEYVRRLRPVWRGLHRKRHG